MKNKIFAVLMLMISFTAYAQEKTAVKTDNQKWKMRLRIIAAVPPSSSYDLSGSDVKVSTSVVPELDFSYFFTKNIAAELILGTTHHNVKLDSKTASTKLGKVWALPPTLSLQYHFNGAKFNPYLGVGINYTIFYGVKDDAAELSYKNKAGFSTQAGFDYQISKKFFLNVDIKKLFLKTDVTVKGTPSTVLSDVKIDPFIFGVGIGTRF
jgi:outer membrane protein